MSNRRIALVVLLTMIPLVSADKASIPKGQMKGIGIYSPECIKVATGVLAKVDGVSEPVADLKTRTITFKAKDIRAFQAGWKALFEAGFAGKPDYDGPIPKDLDINSTFFTAEIVGGGNDQKAVTVKGVHACCPQCQKAIKDLFKEQKVTFAGKGPRKDVTVTGKNLNPAATANAMLKAGFYGELQEPE